MQLKRLLYNNNDTYLLQDTRGAALEFWTQVTRNGHAPVTAGCRLALGGRLSSATLTTAGTVEELFVLITVAGRTRARVTRRVAPSSGVLLVLVSRCSRPMVRWFDRRLLTSTRTAVCLVIVIHWMAMAAPPAGFRRQYWGRDANAETADT